MSGRQLRKHKEKVILNVYDLQKEQNGYLSPFGLGFYHSGVEFYGVEYTFGSGGIFTHEPKGASTLPTENGQGSCVFKESIVLGESDYGSSDASKFVAQLKEQFEGKNYDLMCKNCNHFSDAFSKLLLNSKTSVVPKWVNRMANMGGFFSGIFGNNKNKQDKEQQEAEAKQFQAFNGNGRVLREVKKEAEEVKQIEKKSGLFSLFKRSNSNASSSSSSMAPSAAGGDGYSSLSHEDEEEEKPVVNTKSSVNNNTSTKSTSAPPKSEDDAQARRERMLQATMNRLQKNTAQ